jgi:translocation and assembly module TamB
MSSAVGWSLIGVGALVASTLAHLDSPVARRATCEEVERQLDSALAGDFELDRCVLLSLREVRVEGFRVRAPDGTLVLDVRSAVVSPDLRATIGGVPTAREVRVEADVLDLREPSAIGEAFAARAPSPPSITPTILPRIEIENVRARLARLELPEGLTLTDLALDGAASLGPSVRARDVRVTGAIRRGDGEALAIDVTADADLGANATSRVRAELSRGESSLHATETIATVGGEVRWGAALEDGPAHVDARTELAITPDDARVLGVPELAGLVGGPLRLELHTSGWLDAIEADGSLHAGESMVRIEGSFATDDEGEHARLRVATEGVAPSALVSTLPDAIFAGEVEVTLEPAGDARRITLRGDRLAYDRWTVPHVEADGTLRGDVLELERLALPHLAHDGRLDVTGTFGDAIEVRFDVDVPSVARDANVRALAPGVDARLVGGGRFALRGGRMDVELDLTAHDVNGFGVRARELSVRGTAEGELVRPRARLTIGGTDVRVAGETIERVEARIVGGPSGDAARYALVLDARSGARRLRGDLDARVWNAIAPDVELSGTVDAEGIWPSALHARLADVRVRGTSIAIGDARITDRGGAMLVELSGTVAPRGRSNVHALIDVELAAVEQAYGLAEGLRGRVHVEGALQGALASPEVLLSATATDLAVRDLPSSSARIEASLVPGRGATLSADLRGAGSLEIDATLRSEARTLATSAEGMLDDGTLDARVKASALSLALLELVLPDAPPLSGTVSLEVTIRGTRDAPIVALALEGDDVALEGGDPFDVSLASRWSDDAVEATLDARDTTGPFVNARLRAPLGRDELATLPTDLEAWIARPIELDVDVPSRALTSLPRPLAQGVPIELGVHLEARGGASGPRVDARVAGRWLDVSRVGTCGDARPSFGAEVSFDGSRVDVTSTLREAGGEARLEANASIPWRAWLSEGFVVPTVDATLRSEALALDRLPYACESLAGLARVDVRATGLLGDAPNVRANVELRELRTRESPVVDARIAAEVDARRGRVDVAMIDRASGRTSVGIDGAWNWTWSGTDAPSLDDAEWSANARFDDAAIAPLVAMVPQLADPSGTIDGALRASGRGLEGTPEISGQVALRDVGLTLRDPFVRVSRVQGGIALRDGGVEIDGLRYRDLDGSLRVDGRVGLAGLSPSTLDLRVRARNLPARVEGVIFAYVSADVRVEGDLAARDRRVLDVSLEELAVRVPDESGRSVQSLERHPDVTYVDALPGGLGALASVATTAEEVEPSGEPSVPIEVRVRSTPFWVRRDDFAFQLDANVRSTTDAEGTRLEGPLAIRRGYIELLGKRFELQPGEIRFSGGSSIDPRLDLTALHHLRTGEKVYVDIGGYLSAPTLAFRSPDVEGGDERAVIDLLVRGGAQREAEVAARDQATSVLAGMLAGFLSSMTRRELGAFLPVFRIEAEDARSARVRAGFQADRLIPSWLEGVVRGIYVEGFVGAEEQSGQARAAGGFLLELLFPHDLVGSGKWEQGNNWSLDISWEPR